MGMHRANRRAQIISARPTGTVYARHIGRVGALAVALGVGMAAATTPGVAFADDGSNATENSPAAPTPADNDTPNSDESTRDANGSEPGDAATGTTTSTSGISGTTTVVGGGTTPQVTFGSSGGLNTSGTADDPATPSVTVPTPVTSPPIVDPPTVAPSPTATGDPVVATPPSPSATPPSTAPPASTSADPNSDGAPGAIGDQQADLPRPPAAGSLTANPTARSLVRQQVTGETASNRLQLNAIDEPKAMDIPTPVQPSPSPLETVIALPGTIISTAITLITQALAPLIGPGAPADNPALWAVLAFVRRQFNQTFANSTPVLAPQQTSQDLGVVRGTFGATDADGDVLTYTVPATGLGAPAHGDVTIDQAAGTWTYTPDAGFVGADYFYVTATDDAGGGHVHAVGQGHAAVAAVSVTVGAITPPTNTAPVANPDAFNAVEDTTLVTGPSAATPSLLANDIDAEGNALTAVAATTTTTGGGTVVVNTNGSIVYTPKADFAGVDTFTYQVTDGTATSTGTATVTVAPVNDAPFLEVTAEETGAANGAVKISITFGDVDGDTPLSTTLSAPQHGYYSSTIDGPDITAGVVGTNPVDATATGTTNVAYYIPDPARPGVDTLTFTLTDSAGATITRTTQITVEEPQNSAPTLVLTMEPTNSPNGAIKVTVTIADADTEKLEITIGALEHGSYFTEPVGGLPIPSGVTNTTTEAIGPAGTTATVYYVPDPTRPGTETLSFTLTDPSGASATETQQIVVEAPQNDAPTLVLTTEPTDAPNGAIKVTLTYADPDADVLTLVIGALEHGGYFTEPVGGTPIPTGTSTSGAPVDPAGASISLYYVPDPTRPGTETLSFTLTDPAEATVTKTQQIVVDAPQNDAPTLVLTTEPTNSPNGAIKVTVTIADADTEKLEITIGALEHGSYFSEPVGGLPIPSGVTNTTTEAIGPAGTTATVYYVPDPTRPGTETLSFTLTDPAGATVTQTQQIVVDGDPGNRAPTLSLIAEPTGAANGAVRIIITFADPDADVLTLTIGELAHGGYYTDPINGFAVQTVTSTSPGPVSPAGTTGTFYYRPDPSRPGTETLSFTLVDPDGASVTRTTQIVVEGTVERDAVDV